jgi:predicted O-methyltransferase YrrM
VIDYIGDISKNDAKVLAQLAANCPDILEFGVGASTQVLGHYRQRQGRMISVETDPAWVEKTRRNLDRLRIPHPEFAFYMDLDAHLNHGAKFDLIFDDGVDGLRGEFSKRTWPFLKVGGAFAFHDTRRTGDVLNVCALLAAVSAEVSVVQFNLEHSNITVILKKQAEHYEDWNVLEGRPAWKAGYGDAPEGAET